MAGDTCPLKHHRGANELSPGQTRDESSRQAASGRFLGCLWEIHGAGTAESGPYGLCQHPVSGSLVRRLGGEVETGSCRPLERPRNRQQARPLHGDARSIFPQSALTLDAGRMGTSQGPSPPPGVNDLLGAYSARTPYLAGTLPTCRQAFCLSRRSELSEQKRGDRKGEAHAGSPYHPMIDSSNATISAWRRTFSLAKMDRSWVLPVW